MGPAAANDADGSFLGVDMTPYNAALKGSFRRAGLVVIATEMLLATAWIVVATVNFKFLAVLTWAAASMHLVRIALAVVSVVSVMRPERISTYAVVDGAEARSAQIIRIFGLTTPYTPMMLYGLLAMAIQPALIVLVVIGHAFILWLIGAAGLLLLNVVFGTVSIVHGFVAYQLWQTYGVIRPRAAAIQSARAPK